MRLHTRRSQAGKARLDSLTIMTATVSDLSPSANSSDGIPANPAPVLPPYLFVGPPTQRLRPGNIAHPLKPAAELLGNDDVEIPVPGGRGTTACDPQHQGSPRTN